MVYVCLFIMIYHMSMRIIDNAIIIIMIDNMYMYIYIYIYIYMYLTQEGLRIFMIIDVCASFGSPHELLSVVANSSTEHIASIEPWSSMTTGGLVPPWWIFLRNIMPADPSLKMGMGQVTNAMTIFCWINIHSPALLRVPILESTSRSSRLQHLMYT